MGSREYALLLLPGLPLIGAIFSWGFRKYKYSPFIAISASFAAFAHACYLLYSSVSFPLLLEFGNWLSFADIQVPFSFRLDFLSLIFCLIITGPGALIHLYSYSYIDRVEERERFFPLLNLFLFFMLILVLADSLLLLFLGWEGVGLASYLLIGFWFKECENVKAGEKAFIVNRIGDLGLIFAMGICIYWKIGLNHADILQSFYVLSPVFLFALVLLLLFAATGKSAQLPLYMWLPDAMAGPTPVSALIHAATMVTAGVYLLARFFPLLQAVAVEAQIIICLIGVLTSCWAGLMACGQRELKKVLAWSTISQIGFMFAAIGAQAGGEAVFHVLTHAFFKASLFLSAGSVICACHHSQVMKDYGGLLKKMPITAFAFIGGALALSGMPFFSGFYSKELILFSVYTAPFGQWSEILWLGLILSSFLTAFYISRAFCLTFLGTYRGFGTPRESGMSMKLPLIAFGILSAGWVVVEQIGEYLLHGLEGITRTAQLGTSIYEDPIYHFSEIFALIASCSGLLIGFVLCLYKNNEKSEVLTGKFFDKAGFVDDALSLIILRPLRFFARGISIQIEYGLVQSFANGIAAVSLSLARGVAFFQSGNVGNYIGLSLFGSVVLYIFYVMLR